MTAIDFREVDGDINSEVVCSVRWRCGWIAVGEREPSRGGWFQAGNSSRALIQSCLPRPCARMNPFNDVVPPPTRITSFTN